MENNGDINKDAYNGNGKLKPKRQIRNSKKRKRLIIKYIITTMIIIISFFVVSFVAVFGFVVINGKKNVRSESKPIDISVGYDEAETGRKDKSIIDSVLDSFIAAPRKTNVLLLGLDQSGLLSDVIIVASFDSRTKKIDIISMPRDTYVTITKEQVKELNSAGKHAPSSMKLTDLHSYAGKELGHKYSTEKVEQILGINIDYYAEINLEAFRSIVDSVGGIYVDIPKGGLYYSDPEQNLNISVPGGRQLLTGKQAEGVVRYRNSYIRGDLDRIDMQKLFMKEFFAQVMNKETVMKNIKSFIGTMLDYVKTDFGMDDIPQYLTSLDGISSDKISFYTLPGGAEYFNGGWYYVFDLAETEKLVNNTILNYDIAENKEEAPVNNKGLKIQLLNGSLKSTITSGIKEKIEAYGYTVTDAGDYVESKTIKTRILVKQEGEGEDLKKHFKNAEITVSEDIPAGFDIVIILGKSE